MRFLSFITCILLWAPPVFAGAWTEPQGQAQLILTGSYYSTGSYWDTNGKKQHQPTYSQYALNPYFEYGLTDTTTLGTNLLLERAHQDTVTARYTPHYGLGDSEFFVRQRLWKNDNFVVSAEPMVKLPSVERASQHPQLGGSSVDAGMGLSAGYNFSAYGQNHFAELGTQYRYRFGTAKDQARMNASVGIGITKRLTVMPQLFTTYRIATPKNAAFNNSSGDDYNLVKAQLSAVYKLSEQTAAQIGVFNNVAGRNTGRGSGVFVAFWRHF